MVSASKSRFRTSHASPTRSRIRIWIPRYYRQEPVISRLTSDHSLTVNITGAKLGAESRGEGWFDLELQGTPQQIQSAHTYLEALNIKIWGKPNPDGDSWGL
jgi:NIL domain